MNDDRTLNPNNNAIVTPDSDILWIHPDRLRRFLEFANISIETLAKKSGVPVSTLRKLLQGETKDPKVSTLIPVLKASGADANIVLGLSPARDYTKELSREGTLLADALRTRIDELQRELTANETEVAQLRSLLLEKAEAKAYAESRANSLQAITAQRDETILQQASTIAQYECRMEMKRHKIEELTGDVSKYKTSLEATITQLDAVRAAKEHRKKICRRLANAMCVLLALFLAFTSYFVWELINIDKGLTGRQIDSYYEMFYDQNNG